MSCPIMLLTDHFSLAFTALRYSNNTKTMASTNTDEPRQAHKSKRKAGAPTDGATMANPHFKKLKATMMKMQTLLHGSGVSPNLLAALELELAQPPTILCPITKLPLKEILKSFELSYSDSPFSWKEYSWDMQAEIDCELNENDLLLVKAAGRAVTRPLFFYTVVGARDHEAMCRIPADMMFLEAIAIINGQAQIYLDEDRKWPPKYDASGEGKGKAWPQDRPKKGAESELNGLWDALSSRLKHRTPTQLTRIQLFGEMDLQYTATTPAIVKYTGRCDYSIGLDVNHHPFIPSFKPSGHISILLVCEAKKHNDVMAALNQLLGYLGILHAERRSAGKRIDCTTFGVATDGYKWVFVQVTHVGKVLRSPEIDLYTDGSGDVLRSLLVVLRLSMKLQTPENSPVRKVDAGMVGADGNSLTLLVDENMTPSQPDAEEEASDEEEESGEDSQGE